MVQLREDLLDLLDGEAAQRGISRSALIREAIEEHLAASRRTELGRRIVAGYQRLPQAEPDEWGDLGALGETSTTETLQRLDAEEAAAGLQPW